MAAANDSDSALKTLQTTVNQAPDVSRIYQESKELFKILEPFSTLQYVPFFTRILQSEA
jgi:hypothetical protein